MKILICEQCKKPKEIPEWKKFRFCSKSCATKARGNPTKHKCLTCKQYYFKLPGIKNTKYCSFKCKNIGISVHKVFTCLQCQKNFETRSVRIRRFCTRECYYLFWKTHDYGRKLALGALLTRPTSLEKKMISIINKYSLPYKYVGNGQIWIGGKNPDFIHKTKQKLIEVGNVYHHQNNYAEKRQTHFAEYGWESYIFITNKLNEEVILKTLTS